MIRVTKQGGNVKVPVAQVDQSGFTLPTQGANTPPPALIQVGDFIAYWPISGSTDKTFGAVSVVNLAAGTSSSTNTATGPGAAYLAALVALFTTLKAASGGFLGVSNTQFRLGQTYDGASQLNQASVAVADEIEVSCAALPTDQEVGAYCTIDGDTGGTAGAYTADLLAQQVSFTTDAPESAGSTPCTVDYAVGRLVERAPAGATKVKIRLLSQLV